MIRLMIYYIPYLFSDAPRDLISMRLKTWSTAAVDDRRSRVVNEYKKVWIGKILPRQKSVLVL